MKYDVAIVIPTYNESHLIHRTLDFFSQKTSFLSKVIVVVDNNSTDKTPNLVNSWMNKNKAKNIYLLNEFKKGSIYARQKGMLFAKDNAKAVVSTDADMTPVGTFFKNLKSDFLSNTNADILRGYLRNDPRVRLFKRLYLPELMKVIYWQESIEVRIFGPVFFGGYFGIKSDKINELALPIINIPNIFEATPYWSKHCFYLGYKFVKSRPDLTHSNRRFWVDPFGSISGNRVKPIRNPELIGTKKRKIFEYLQQKQNLLIKIRQEYFAERLLFFLIDAVYFSEKVDNTNIVNHTIEKACEELEFNKSILSELRKKNFTMSKNNFLNKYKHKTLKLITSKYSKTAI